ncbi:tail fiber/spike domain-containing protein [Escherichia coli]
MPTQKPVPSNDIKDLLFNSGLLDEWATSVEKEYIDRFGSRHLTAAGMEWAFQQLVEKFNIDMDSAIRAAGYVLLDSFQQGVKLPNNEITLRNQALRDERTGEYYRWNGDLPKQVLAGSTPESTGGVITPENPTGLWVGVGSESVRSWVQENYNRSPLLKMKGVTFTTGAILLSSDYVLQHTDGFYYQYVGAEQFPLSIFPGSQPADDWACVGLLSGYHVDDIRNYITQELRLVDSFNLSQNSKQKRGGGCIFVPSGDYYLEDELALIDFVRFVGEGERVCRIFGAPSAIGTGKAVVRSSKLPITTTENPAYLSHTGFTDATINGNGVFDVGLYVRNTTNESKFTNVTTQNCKIADTNIISSWYVNMDNHVSRDALGYGVVIGRKLFNEVGLDEVNACSFLNLRSNYSGKNDLYDPVNAPYAGAGITIWKATSCAFDYVGAENSYGVGCVIRKGIVSVIPNIYTEANGKGSKAVEQIGVHVVNADFAPLQIGSLNLTANQKLHMDSGVVCEIGSLYTHDFNAAVFRGTGKVILRNPQDANLLNAADLAFVRNIESETIAAYWNVPMVTTSFNALDNSQLYCGVEKSSARVIFVPRVSFVNAENIYIRFLTPTGNIDIDFGRSFTAGVPVSRAINLPAGITKLKQQSNVLPAVSTGAAADIIIKHVNISGFPIFNIT